MQFMIWEKDESTCHVAKRCAPKRKESKVPERVRIPLRPPYFKVFIFKIFETWLTHFPSKATCFLDSSLTLRNSKTGNEYDSPLEYSRSKLLHALRLNIKEPHHYRPVPHLDLALRARLQSALQRPDLKPSTRAKIGAVLQQ